MTLDGSEATPRWRLLETVRVYALEKLSDERRARARPCAASREFCLALFAPFAREAELQAAIDDLGRYRREVDNLRAALNWAFSPGGDTALAIELAATATDFWIAASLVAECCEWAEKALARDRRRRRHAQRDGPAMQSRHRPDLYAGNDAARPRGADCRRWHWRGGSRISTIRQRATCGLWLFSARSMALNDAFAFAREYEEAARGRDLHSRATAAWLVGVPQTYLADHVRGERAPAVGDRSLPHGKPAPRHDQARRRPARVFPGPPHGQPALAGLAGCRLARIEESGRRGAHTRASRPCCAFRLPGQPASFRSASANWTQPTTTAKSSSGLPTSTGCVRFMPPACA